MPEVTEVPTTIEEQVDMAVRRIHRRVTAAGGLWEMNDEQTARYIRGLVESYVADTGRLPPLDPSPLWEPRP